MNRMNTPRTRAEFERNFHLLQRQVEDGKFHVAEDLSHSLDGLARVRRLPNGRIDFLSVDETARLHANMTAQFSEEWFQEQQRAQGSPEQKPEADSGDKPNP
jgi:hypothetical protein